MKRTRPLRSAQPVAADPDEWRKKSYIPSELRQQSAQARSELLKRQTSDVNDPVLARALSAKRLRDLHRRETYFLEQAISFCTVLANARKFRANLTCGNDVFAEAAQHLEASRTVRAEIIKLRQAAAAKGPRP